MGSQRKLFEHNWDIFSAKMIEERNLSPDDQLVYLGRNFYDSSNPPFIASVIKISSTLWEKIQLIQANIEKTDNRQTYFHPNYFHITLNEFGWLDQVNVDEVTEKLAEIFKNLKPFDLTIQGINCFDRIIFAQVFDVQRNLDFIFNKTLELFPNLEKHFPDYIPHISLIKIDTPEAKDIINVITEKFRRIEIGTMRVDRIQLVAARPYLSVGRSETITEIVLD